VIKASKQFFPKFRRGFEDPRINIYYGDGAQFLKDHPNTFDVVITDSSDPIGENMNRISL
jgi:spermidine synthase